MVQIMAIFGERPKTKKLLISQKLLFSAGYSTKLEPFTRRFEAFE